MEVVFRKNGDSVTTKPRAVIVAAGEFPRRDGPAWAVLAAAERVVCCDGAVRAYRRRMGRWPDAVVGDLDSAGRLPKACRVVRVAEQETNDLEKALRWCRAEGWMPSAIVGATGRREDHAIGNVFRALEAEVPIVTDHGTFHPLNGRLTLSAPVGTGVSVFVADASVRLRSEGLAWPLDGVRFRRVWTATLNRTARPCFTVAGTGKAFVFVENAPACKTVTR